MDGKRFDELSRSLASRHSRRGVLKTIGAGSAPAWRHSAWGRPAPPPVVRARAVAPAVADRGNPASGTSSAARTRGWSASTAPVAVRTTSVRAAAPACRSARPARTSTLAHAPVIARKTRQTAVAPAARTSTSVETARPVRTDTAVRLWGKTIDQSAAQMAAGCAPAPYHSDPGKTSVTV
jgi:hypothetical protein